MIALGWAIGCAEPPTELRPVGPPSAAPGVVLLAQLGADVITVDGVLDGAEQWVDIDAGEDRRYGFRYQVIGQDGEVMLSRGTIGPAFVEAFLAYWSAVAGVDILAGIPTLGRFPLTVPILDGADHVELQVMGEDGEYATRGTWSYERLGDERIQPEPQLAPIRRKELHGGRAGPWDTLDFVILPDGYTEGELDKFADDADKVVDKLLAEEPFASYADHVTITRLDVPSNQSGASYECPTCNLVDNAFGSIFPIELINRVTNGDYPNRPMFQAEQWKIAEAMAGEPWDVGVVLVNSPTFGAMAVHFASITRGVEDLGPTAVHEIGHAFGMLGDEYVYDACVRTPGMPLPENVTDRPDDPPWMSFVAPETPLPTPPGEGWRVGTFAGAWNCPDLYRPEEECRMNEGHGAFCAVCLELLTRRLMRFGDPASGVELVDRRVVIQDPLPDTFAVVTVDGEVLGQGPVAGSEWVIPDEARSVDVEVRWDAADVRDDPTSDLAQTWSFGL